MQIINDSFWIAKSLEKQDLAEALAKALEKLRAAFYSSDTSRMDYSHLALSEEYSEFVLVARALNKIDLTQLTSGPAQKAFWLNVYNGLVLHAVVALGVTKSVRDASGFYDRTAWRVAGHVLTLDDVEHGILRGNTKKYRGINAQFGSTDPRRILVLLNRDPQIHFGLYSACGSSPMMRIFRADDVDEKLTESAIHYLRANVDASQQGSTLALPKLFQWYGEDFGDGERIALFVAECLNVASFQRHVRGSAGSLRLTYLDFDWALNGPPPPYPPKA